MKEKIKNISILMLILTIVLTTGAITFANNNHTPTPIEDEYQIDEKERLKILSEFKSIEMEESNFDKEIEIKFIEIGDYDE